MIKIKEERITITHDTAKRLLWIMYYTGKGVYEVMADPVLVKRALSDKYKERLEGDLPKY